MAHSVHIKLDDPEELEQVVGPIAGQPHVRPARGADFHASLTLRPRGKVGLFTVKADSIDVQHEPNMQFFGLNLPLSKPMRISQDSQSLDYLDDINLTRPDLPLHLQVVEDCRCLAVCLYKEQTQEFTAKLTRSARPLESRMQTRVDMATPAGHALMCSLAHLWSEPLPDNQAPGAQLRLAELEDEVITNYILAATQANEDSEHSSQDTSPRSLGIAEDYLCSRLDQPVSRAELAETCCVSIRTLSRVFMQRHGVGPMQFLKSRRLDAAYRILLGSNPWSITVTEVALRYGFTHLGKFAIDYRQAFGESPSATLRG